MRFSANVVAAITALYVQGSAVAHAGLIGNGTNTVVPSFWIPLPNNSPPLTTTSPPPITCTTSLPCEVPNYALPSPPNPPGSSQNFPPPTAPVDFLEGASSLSTISVSDTQITITNIATGLPFCSTALPCSNPFVGFQFVFSSLVDITGVSVDSASSPNFLPNDTAPHDGLQLLSPTRIVVDVTGDSPNANDQLILDLTFPGSVTPGVPEPSTWALMLLGFAGLGLAGYRRSRGAARA